MLRLEEEFGEGKELLVFPGMAEVVLSGCH